MEYVEKPKRWDIGFIKQFMFSLGPVSSLFDFMTFFIMILVFNIPFINPSSTQISIFQTAWFIESLASQTVVVFAIRTRRSPFWKSKPSKLLLISCIIILTIGLVIPFIPVANMYFNFTPPPALFFVFLALLLGAYLALTELVKQWFYKRNSYRTEQSIIPKRRPFYLNRNSRLVHDVTAVICLRSEKQINFASLNDALSKSLNYPIESKQINQSLHFLRRSGLITIDWRRKTIKREDAMKEYVKKRVITNEMWPLILEDWLNIFNTINSKYGETNEEYSELVTSGQT